MCNIWLEAPTQARKCYISQWCSCGIVGWTLMSVRTVTWLPKLLQWIDSQIFLAMGIYYDLPLLTNNNLSFMCRTHIFVVRYTLFVLCPTCLVSFVKNTINITSNNNSQSAQFKLLYWSKWIIIWLQLNTCSHWLFSCNDWALPSWVSKA